MATPVCVVCKAAPLVTKVAIDRNVCDECARRTGNIVMPPPRRRASPCARCNHTKLVRAIPRELTVTPNIESNVPTFGPMFAAYELRHVSGEVQPLNARFGFGVLEAYICRACGYVDWYCQDPDEIPIGPEYMTEEVDATGPSPFR